MNSDLRKMQSEMISKPCQRFASASIDTEVDRILDRLLPGNNPHAYLSSHFLRSNAMTHFVRVETVMHKFSEDLGMG